MSEVVPLEPSCIVIFGITGDLSKRYLLPALFHLTKIGLLNSQSTIIGVSRQLISTQELLDGVDLHSGEPEEPADAEALQRLQNQITMVRLDLENVDDYKELKQHLDTLETERGVCMNRIYYLSIPPKAFNGVIDKIGLAGLNGSCSHGTTTSRILVEKPFGYNLESAQALIDETGKVFTEEQLFRIDHYLAKETVQNILTFRFENPIFESLWSHEHIDAIEIYAGEQIGIMGRKVFYEPLGALRDFIQSHLLQLLAIVTMDKPEILDSAHIHAQKQALLQSVQPVDMNPENRQAIRGQYEGYRAEVENPESSTETFAAINVAIQSERWNGVPITIWTGKGLAEKRTEIVITFKNGQRPPNRLRFRISPNEGIEIELLAKKPGYAVDLQTAHMDFSYNSSFNDFSHPNAYERVLVDAIRGDHTLFATSQEVIAAWLVVQPVLDSWASGPHDDLQTYPMGTSGASIIKPLLES